MRSSLFRTLKGGHLEKETEGESGVGGQGERLLYQAGRTGWRLDREAGDWGSQDWEGMG